MNPHPSENIQKRFLISIGLTALVLVAEVIGGLWTGSLALLSDSAHVFMDIFALGLSFIALRLSALPPDDRHTYGYHRLEVLAALTNGVTLGAISVGIFVEAYRRFMAPGPVRSGEMMGIALVGLLVNLVVALVLRGHRHSHAIGVEGQHAGHDHTAAEDINVRSAYLHVLGDAVSSVGVIAAGLIISITGWQWVDPAASVLIGVLILVSSLRVVRGALHILVEGVPEGLSLAKINRSMGEVAGVLEVHDLHVWSICSGHVSLSAHVVLCEEAQTRPGATMEVLKGSLSRRFGIEHTTVQFEAAVCGAEQGNCSCH